MQANNQNEKINLDEPNQDAYDDLIVSIEAGEGKLNLLIGVCDRIALCHQIIERYETELNPHFHTYRITLDAKEPNLKVAIQQLVEKSEYLQQHQPSVITVTGTEKLSFLRLGEEQSAQEKFFGYLQWTREGLREFPFTIILWVTHQLMVNLIKKAPDFWSWRNGVFRFVSHKKNVISTRELEGIRFALTGTELEDFNSDNDYFLPLEDLQILIQQIEQQSGIKDAKLASLYMKLAKIYEQRWARGEAQDYQKELDLAIEYSCKALKLQKELGLDEDFATSLDNLAGLYYFQGRYEQAESLYQKALSLKQRLLGEEHPSVTSSYNNLAFLYYSQGRYTEAESLYQKALSLRQRFLGEEHLDVASSYNNLAFLYSSQGRYEQAESLYQKALSLRQRLLGKEHPDVAQIYNNLANLYSSQGRYEQAESLYQKALTLMQRFLGEEHSDVAQIYNNLAELYEFQGRYSEAESLYQKALSLRQRLLGEEHPSVADSYNNLALLYSSQGRYEQAEPLFKTALEMMQKLLGEEHPFVATSYNNLANLYYSQRRYTEAEPLFQKALELRQRLLGEEHPSVATSYNNLANLYYSQGRYSEAEPLFQKALELRQRLLGEEHPDVIRHKLKQISFCQQ